jgi:hypothetical protein
MKVAHRKGKRAVGALHLALGNGVQLGLQGAQKQPHAKQKLSTGELAFLQKILALGKCLIHMRFYQ